MLPQSRSGKISRTSDHWSSVILFRLHYDGVSSAAIALLIAMLMVFGVERSNGQVSPATDQGQRATTVAGKGKEANDAAEQGAEHSGDPEADADSADIPPFARGLIDEATYFRLRDEHLQLVRGVPDLIDNPQARSSAIGHMERQERLIRAQANLLTLFGGFSPAVSDLTLGWNS